MGSIYDYIQSAAETVDMPLCELQDSSKYTVELINDADAKKTKGGYTLLRAKTTRPKRRKFSTGFTYLTEEQRAQLEEFWGAIGSGSKAFYWTRPIIGDRLRVIFSEGESLQFKYVGIGGNHYWDCDFTIEET